jgi:DNA gyrase subunit A
MAIHRPDLSGLDPSVREYIEYLEAEIQRLTTTGSRRAPASKAVPLAAGEPEEEQSLPPLNEPAEPPTTLCLISAAANGLAKRTPRHLYNRQRRGGMGIFDIDTPKDNPPAILAQADQGQNLIIITDQARAFRLPLAAIPETEVRARGESFIGRLSLSEDEQIACILPDQVQGYIALLSQSGMARLLRHHVFGEYMKPGTALYDFHAFGPLASACWTSGNGDLFIAAQSGKAIRFAEKSLPPQGGPGIRLGAGDRAVAITSVDEESNVFLLAADGRGTIRSMSSFLANKAPGAGGKAAMATENLVAAAAALPGDDLVILSRQSKIIRFSAADIPIKDSVVQGVNCMALRGDVAVAALVCPPKV